VTESIGTAAASAEGVRADARPVVLIVDDTPANLAYLSDALDEAGYMVLVALDGDAALERLNLMLPDIILLDAVMPGRDGFETCRAIKAHPAARDTPVIFMTGLVECEHIVRAFEAGAVDYVTKPVRQEEALARIATHIRRSRTLLKAHRSIEACGKAGLTMDVEGNITWQTPHVRSWLRDYLGDDPGGYNWMRLRSWLSSLAKRDAASRESQSPFCVVQAQGRLNMYFAGEISNYEYLLLIDEQRAEASTRRLAEAHNLTAREAEVLNWLAAGKTNRDIAEILGMSPRTVNKHLEHIYVKLGVETRSAAAAIAVQAMTAPMPVGKS
jgi:DNA-binding NarL/FixJ family response regulator